VAETVPAAKSGKKPHPTGKSEKVVQPYQQKYFA
jgi:hypothetical protein